MTAISAAVMVIFSTLNSKVSSVGSVVAVSVVNGVFFKSDVTRPSGVMPYT